MAFSSAFDFMCKIIIWIRCLGGVCHDGRFCAWLGTHPHFDDNGLDHYLIQMAWYLFLFHFFIYLLLGIYINQNSFFIYLSLLYSGDDPKLETSSPFTSWSRLLKIDEPLGYIESKNNKRYRLIDSRLCRTTKIRGRVSPVWSHIYIYGSKPIR